MTATRKFMRLTTSLGPLYITATGAAVTSIHFEAQAVVPRAVASAQEQASHPLLLRAAGEIIEYLDGRRRIFELPVAAEGTPFQRCVWDAIARIGYGTTISYGALAARIGCPRSVRAVGAATGRNPLALVIPCHRIVGAGGALTGYAGGLDTKRRLLALEQPMVQLVIPYAA